MIVTVELASALAQITPVFLVILLFESKISTRNTAAAPVHWALLMNTIRMIAGFAVLTLFVLSLLVGGSGRPASAVLSLIIFTLLLGLVTSVAFAIWYSYTLDKTRILNEAQDSHSDDSGK